MEAWMVIIKFMCLFMLTVIFVIVAIIFYCPKWPILLKTIV